MKVIRVCICCLIVFEVLAFGGVQPWAEGILEIAAAALLLFWAVLAMRNRRLEIASNWLFVPLLGLCVLALVQLVSHRSVYPYLTKVELLKWGACLLLFFLVLESFRTIEDASRFVWFLILLGFCVSLFGIIQLLTSNGKLYWMVPLSHGGAPFGPYVNRDDFAGFVELTSPLGLAVLLFRAWPRERAALLMLLTMAPVGALVLTASRGGVIGFLFELALLLLLSRADQLRRKQLLVAAALTLLAGIFLVWLGVGEALHRFQQLTAKEISRDRRVSVYRDTLQIFTDHPWTGTGLGTFVAVYPQYETAYDGLVVDHAHNDYLELLAEGGVAGGCCGLTFVGVLLRWGLRNLLRAEGRRLRAVYAGALTGCCGLLLHSLADFNLHIPANALLFLMLAALATSSLVNGPRVQDAPTVRAIGAVSTSSGC